MSRRSRRPYAIGRLSRAGRIRAGFASLLAGALIASGLVAGPASAEPAEPKRLTAQTEKLDKDGREVAGIGWKPKPPSSAKVPAPVWPAAGTKIAVTAPSAQRAASAAGREAAPAVTAEVVGRDVVPERWRAGVVARLNGRAAGNASISMDYSAYRYAYGANWSSRLRLWRLPECALTTPDQAGCTASPLPSRNDTAKQTVTAQVPLTGSSAQRSAAAASSGGTLVALAAGPSGDSGDFGASPLSASSSWSAGGSTGAFSWSYPMRTPPGISGTAPGVTLSYSSAGADGHSSATNNQPSWVGEGFDYAPGFIERRYVSCVEDDKGTQNSPEHTGDLCWRSNNAVMSLAGSSTELIYESSKGWHARSEDGSKIAQLTGGTNDDDNGEHWRVTGTDGTQYFFGLNKLPGQDKNTNSAWTVPVYGNHPGEPGHATKFSDSRTTQAWRWNLDYVIDTHGNTTSYWYNRETNQYAAEATESKNLPYVRGGTLSRIDYGTWDRSSTDRSVKAVAQIVFETADRCNSGCSAHDGAHWRDTPWDQECKAEATSCDDFAPTFWSTKRLAKVVTRIWDTTKATPAWQDVDSYTLTHSFPSPGDGDAGGLWLDSIVHTGHVAGSASFPAITFEPVAMQNRVKTKTNTTNNWQRLANIYTETGARIQVIYSLRDCSSDDLPSSPANNTKLCYPVIGPDPYDIDGPDITEWWHKYVVTKVTESDTKLENGQQAPNKTTYYTYGGHPAWHYADDDGLSKPKRKTWDQFRGYSTVTTQVGDRNKTLTKTTFMRGMHGDRTASGDARTVTVPASLGSETVYDEDQFAGMVRETVVYNGTETKPVSKTVNVPWRSSPTASRTINGDTVTARYSGTTTTYNGTALGVDGARGWRVTSSHTTFDDTYGIATSIQENGDTSKTGDERCTTTTYNRNTAKNIVTLPERVTVTTLPCGTAPSSDDHIISDTQTFYDGATSASTDPVRGELTRTDVLKNWSKAGGTSWLPTSTATFDAFGRGLTAVDSLRGTTTTSAYSPANGLVTKRTDTLKRADTARSSWVTTTELHPAWASPTKITDPNGRINEATYDPLGRTSKVWEQGWLRSEHGSQPSSQFTYVFDQARVNYPYVKSEVLNAAGGTDKSFTIYDGLLRGRQTQAEAVGGDRVVTDTLYDEHGRPEVAYGAHTEPGDPSGALWAEPQWSVPQQTLTHYDRAGRATASIFQGGDGKVSIVEKWRTTTSYEGDRVTVVPPKGGIATTTLANALGKAVELREYSTEAGPAGAYVATKYGYNGKDQLASVTDAGENRWTYKYDIRGRQIEAVDPDKGKTTSVYNDAGDLTKTTDARGEVLVYTYDDLGRRTGLYDDAVDATKVRAEWKYDKLWTGRPMRNKLTEAVRYDNGNAYKWQASAFDLRYAITSEQWVIPAAETGLDGTYSYSHGYSQYTGDPTTLTYPATAGLTTETVTTTYDSTSAMPDGLKTNLPNVGSYVVGQMYTGYGEPTITTLKTDGGTYAEQSISYELDTRRIHRVKVKPETSAGTVADRVYTYDEAGNPLSITDTPEVGSADKQCFRYDHLQRLTSAWTPGLDTDCKSDPNVGNLAGPAPYWLDWKIDNLGNRTEEISHSAAGDTRRSYTSPVPGPGVVRPHAVTSMTTTAPGQPTETVSSYGYDDAGNMKSRPGATAEQTLTWDAEGRPVKVVEGAKTFTNLYDADGSRLIRRDPTGTTLYLPGMEVRRNVSGNTATLNGTRYYSFNGQTVASRTTENNSLTWLFADPQGTQQTAVNANTQKATIRRQLPYGDPRGPEPAWPNSKGFVGGDKDPTGLTHIGAREYDPVLGRFISVDPIQDLANPQQWNAYSYAGNNPIGRSDPTGLFWDPIGLIIGVIGIIGAITGGGGDSGGNGSGNGGNGGNGGSGTSTGNGGGNGGGGNTVTSVLSNGYKAQYDALYESTVGVGTGIYSLFQSAYYKGKADGEAIANGDMTWTQALWGQAKWQWNNLPGMGGSSYKFLKGLFDEGKKVFTADTWGERAYAGSHLVSTIALMFVGPKGLKVKPKTPVAAAVDGVEGAAPARGAAKPKCNSFAPGTLVLMADRTSKPISEVQTGDQVVATDPETGITEDRAVVAKEINDDHDFTDLTIKVGADAEAVIETTQEHLIWDAAKKDWRNARDLEIGTPLHTANGRTAEVAGKHSYRGQRWMYNLEVADIHTFYVFAGNTPVLVHNCGFSDRASEIHGAEPDQYVRDNISTVAVVRARTPHGVVDVIAGSGDGLTPAQMSVPLRPGEMRAPNIPGTHAEQNAFLHINEQGWTPIAGGTSRNVCLSVCAPWVRGSGGRMMGNVYPGSGVTTTRQRSFEW